MQSGTGTASGLSTTYDQSERSQSHDRQGGRLWNGSNADRESIEVSSTHAVGIFEPPKTCCIMGKA